CRNARRHLQRPKHIAKLDQAKESGMAHYGDPEVFKLAGTDKWYCHHCCGIWHGEIRITSHVVSNRHYGNKAKVRNVLDDENKVMNSDYEDVLVKKDSGLWRCLLCHQQVLAKSYTEAVRHLDSPTHGISVRKAKTSGTAYHDEPDVFQFKGATKWYCQICSVIIRDVEQTTAHVISNKHIENKTLMQQGREL
ncbi:uncharacterized protein LOC102807627, partial [Saccoglossus kowalevskii]|uniref:Uncharacterized protein LOC102807627 n=1 Tax=Saccoglossus kowalevskii TaxID=10224 RepID=A0ABM0ML83_SACKO